MTTTIVLGEEHDRALRELVVRVLAELGARGVCESWGVGGSQELATLEVALDGETLIVEAETYVGLSITGDPRLVERVAEHVREHPFRR